MDGAKLVACVHPPPPPPSSFPEARVSVHRLLNVLLCHWLRRQSVLQSVRAAETKVALSVLN